jgi:hypothetical protein
MNHPLPIALVALGLLAVPTVASTAESSRFTASAEVHPQGRSADGRFVASGAVTVQPAAASADGRFVLKATHAPSGGCPPTTDAVFANGFEP